MKSSSPVFRSDLFSIPISRFKLTTNLLISQASWSQVHMKGSLVAKSHNIRHSIGFVSADPGLPSKTFILSMGGLFSCSSNSSITDGLIKSDIISPILSAKMERTDLFLFSYQRLQTDMKGFHSSVRHGSPSWGEALAEAIAEPEAGPKFSKGSGAIADTVAFSIRAAIIGLLAVMTAVILAILIHPKRRGNEGADEDESDSDTLGGTAETRMTVFNGSAHYVSQDDNDQTPTDELSVVIE
jgi:hypothetical protein